MASSPDLHDAEIERLWFDRRSRSLELGLRLDDGRLATIRCCGVVRFEFDSYEEQNVLYALHVQDWPQLSENTVSELDIISREALIAGAHYVELEPSVGMGGWVVASNVYVEGL